MKKILFLFLCLFISNGLFSQVTMRTSLKCQVYASSGASPTFIVQSLISDELSKFDASDVLVGDKLFIIDGSECYELHIDSILVGAGSLLDIRVIDSSATLSTITNGQGAVVSQYTNKQTPFITSGLRDDLASCVFQKLSRIVDEITGANIDSTFVRNDSILLASNGDEYFTGIATEDGNGIYGGSGTSSAIVTGNGLTFRPQSFTAFDIEATVAGNGLVGIKPNGQPAAWYTGFFQNSFWGGFAASPIYSYRIGSIGWGLRMSADAAADFNRIDIATGNRGVRIGNDFSFFSNFTTLMTGRPTDSASFWQHNTNGTGEYKTPGNMNITNPFGGSGTVQGTVDSLYQNTNQIIIAADSFYVNDQNQPVYVVSAGDTITIPTAAAYTAGSGIAISGGGVISATDNSISNELQTLSIVGNDLTLSNGGGTIVIPSDGNGIYSGNGDIPAFTAANTLGPFAIGDTNGAVGIGIDPALGVDITGTAASISVNDSLSLNDGYTTGTIGQILVATGGLSALWTDASEVADGNGIYSGNGNVPANTQASLLGNFTITTGDAGLAINLANSSSQLSGANSFITVSDSVQISITGNDGNNGEVLTATNGDGSYWSAIGALPVTNPSGGNNTLQATLDSISKTWLKPKLEANNVSINAQTNTLTFQRTAHAVKSTILNSHAPATGVQKYVILKDSTQFDNFSIYNSTAGYTISNPTGKGLTIEGDGATLTIKGTTNVNSGSTEFVSKTGFQSTVKASDTLTLNTTFTLPKTSGTTTQILTAKGGGITAWEDNINIPSFGLLTKSGTTAISLTTAYQEICFTTTSMAENIGISPCLVTGGLGFINTSGRTRVADVSFQAGLLQVSGSTQRIFVIFYVNGVAASIRHSDGVFNGNTSYAGINARSFVSVPNNATVTVAVAKQSAGTTNVDFYDISFALNFIN